MKQKISVLTRALTVAAALSVLVLSTPKVKAQHWGQTPPKSPVIVQTKYYMCSAAPEECDRQLAEYDIDPQDWCYSQLWSTGNTTYGGWCYD